MKNITLLRAYTEGVLCNALNPKLAFSYSVCLRSLFQLMQHLVIKL